jgi:A/G-specific adenine glycosylase
LVGGEGPFWVKLVDMRTSFTSDIIIKEANLDSSLFVQSVIRWFYSHGRIFPWRETSNPFHILVAEVLLRQTQARRVVEPYQDLIKKYPNAQALAKADIIKLRRWFRPLGLIRRADYLVHCAQALIKNYAGQVPNDLKALESLPGLGRYSARAILCLGFNQPVPMIDESGGRVLRRTFGNEPKGPAFSDPNLMEAVNKILPHKCPRDFNLGLIDIADAYCHASKPDCMNCPVLKICAYGTIHIISKKVKG